MANCRIKVNASNEITNEVVNELKKQLGDNNTNNIKYIVAISDPNTNNYDNKFVKWYKTNYSKSSIEDTPENVAKNIIKYYKEEIEKSYDLIIDGVKVDKVIEFGYNSIEDRTQGLKHIAAMFLKVNNALAVKGIEIQDNDKFRYYITKVRSNLNRYIFASIAKRNNQDIKLVVSEYKNSDDKLTYITNNLDKDSITDSNLLALYKELNGSKEVVDSFINEVLVNPILKGINLTKNYEALDTDENTSLAADASAAENDILNGDNSIEQDFEFDSSIYNLNNHLGNYSTYMKHVSGYIRNYFNGLYKLNSTEKVKDGYDFDINNNFGIPDTMDAEQCITMMYSINYFNNEQEMIDLIYRVADTVKGYEAFKKFGDDLVKDADFRYAVFSTFAKTIISKKETRLEDGVVTTRTSNERADPATALFYDLRNNIRSTAIQNSDDEYIEEKINKIKEDVAYALNNPVKNIDILINEVINLVRSYYPTLSYNDLYSFINNYNTPGNDIKVKLKNINILNSIIDNTRKGAITTRQLYYDKRNNNKAMDDYISTDSDKAIYEIRNIILPFVAVNLSLNSRNVHGNQSSDIINNSMITRIKRLLNSERNGRNEVLEQWALDKLRSKQYKYSLFFLNHKDEKGNIINRGLFTNVNGNYVLNSYYKDIFAIEEFNGTSNVDDNVNLLYSEMTSGDYVPTSYINFFKEEDIVKQTASYFLRIPSDAPNTFCIRAPRYSTTKLFVDSNPKETSNKIESILKDVLNNINITTRETTKYKGKSAISLAYDNYNISDYVLGKKKEIYVDNTKRQYIYKEGDKHVVIVRNGNSYFVFKGDVNERFKNVLENVELTEVIGSVSEEIQNDIRKYYYDKLSKNDVTINGKIYSKIEKTIDENHQVFKIFQNIFKQEMLNAAVALEHYFEIDENGYIAKKNVNGTLTPVVKKGVNINEGYNFYHLGKNGSVLEPIYENGKIARYKLGGKVFGSNKFTLNKITNGKFQHINYFDRLFSDDVQTRKDDGMIHFLYGGAKAKSHLNMIKDENGNVVDVTFTEEQQKEINNILKEFIVDYCNQIAEELNDKKEFIKGVSLSTNNINEYALNNFMANVMFDDILEGDTKFYKDSRTGLKRAKSYQGSGVPYGIVNYAERDSAPMHDIEDSFLETGTYIDEVVETTEKDGKQIKVKKEVTKPIKELFKGTILEGIKQRNKFKAVTIKNSIRTNEKALNELVNKLSKEGLDRESALNLLYGPVVTKDGKIVTDKDGNPKRRGAFTEIKVNDAQSYITFDEWVRRIAARGQLKRYIPLIKKVLDPNSELSNEELKEFIQVQKNFYYDQYYDEKYGIYVPRIVKNSEFVLIPRFIKGTQLEKVYDLMKEAGIDQLNTIETSKAANENILTLWNNDGDITEDTLKTFVSEAKLNAKDYSYNYLYTQQETPQHMNASNKAGIQFLKKIVDNLSPDDRRKLAIWANYTANIEESANDLFDACGIERDENGNIVLDEDGNIKNFDKSLFYKKLYDEFLRTGLDSNTIDYVTIDPETNEPVMPSCMSNILLKFESVFQSIFNNYITRQKLPGFHAAQVTNIGWKSLDGKKTYHLKTDKNVVISEDEYNNLSDEDKKLYSNVSYSKELRYHPNGEGYIEIMLPYSVLGINKSSEHYKNMTDEEILNELKESGLDEVIGYRIPTEGKQSICVMKIVGFIDSSMGSCIIVPDDWVSQTGSDFDIDSVYGIQYETYKDKDGRLRKVQYNKGANLKDWIHYVKRNSETKIDNVGSIIKEKFDALNKSVNSIFAELIEAESKAFSEVLNTFKNKEDRNKFIKLFKGVKEKVKRENPNDTGQQLYDKQLKEYNNKLSIIKNNFKKKKLDTTSIDNLIEINNQISEFINSRTDNYNEKRKDILEEVYTKYIEDINKKAKDAGLYNQEKYNYIIINHPEKLNSRAARNNKILESVIDILKDPANLEENLSRSNFDDITFDLNNCMNKNVKLERDNRNPYNILDQARYQEEAMAGAKLKGFSVSLDTLCSVCNVSKATLDTPIYVVYNKEDFEDAEKEYKRFNNVKVGDKIFSIKHDMYGWSKDNRAIGGKILTSYSSQTTAYILDAIKEGSIPNVNDYTFSVFKTLVNVGTNYKTAISFIMNPGISRIVNEYTKSKSVFLSNSNNVVHEAIKGIAKELGITFDYKTPIQTILKELNDKYKDKFNKIFRQKGDDELSITLNSNKLVNLPVIGSKLYNRLKEIGEFSETSPVEDRLLFDLGNILIFNRLHSLANQIGNIAQCLTTDKFGAKQTIFSTMQVFKNIEDILYDTSGVIKVEKKPILKVGNKHILQAIYPNIENGIKGIITSNNISESAYPPLYAFLKYSTATSIMLSQRVLPIQNPAFVQIMLGLPKVFSGLNPVMTEEVYKDFQNYLLNYFYSDVTSIKYPIRYDVKSRNIIPLTTESSTEERQRIFGYGAAPSLKIIIPEVVTDGKVKKTIYNFNNFIPANVNKITQEEADEFAKFTPAQKVQWIKTNLTNEGIFKRLSVNLLNIRKRGRFAGMQTIEFINKGVNSNILYEEFYNAVNNENPLIAMTAYDLVKYATVVEGLKMSQYGISQIIDNDVLKNDLSNGGMNFVNELRERINNLGTTNSSLAFTNNINTVYENYLRSHPETKGIRKLYWNKTNVLKYNLQDRSFGIIYITTNNTAEDPIAELNERMVKCGIKTYDSINNTYVPNKYIRIIKNNSNSKFASSRNEPVSNTLYRIVCNDKVVESADGNGEIIYGSEIILYPLNNLQSTENAEFSANAENNKYYSKRLYDKLLLDYFANREEEKFTIDVMKNGVLELIKSDSNYAYRRPLKFKNIETIDFDINNVDKLIITKDRIKNHFTNNPNTILYLRSLGLTDYIKTTGQEYASRQKININGKPKYFLISKVNTKNYNLLYLKKDKKGNTRRDVSKIKNDDIRNIYESAKENGIEYVNDLYVVTEDTNQSIDVNNRDKEAYTASLEELDVNALEYMQIRRNSNNDIIAVHSTENIKNKGIDNTIESVQANIVTTTREIARYAKLKADELKKSFEQFIEDPINLGSYISITDDRIQDIISENPALLNKYLEILNETRAFRDKFDMYKEFNIQSSDASINFYLKDIKDSVDIISKLPLDDAENNFATGYISKLSSNPLIKNTVINIMDNYYRTYGSMWMFHDITENGNPLLQIILKDVLGNVETARMMFIRRREDYRNKVKEIINKAKKEGLDVDINKIIQNGQFVQDYSKEFENKIEELRQDVRDNIRKYGEGSIEHLKAKLAYDEFKSKYVNQEAKPKYYINKVRFERIMIEQHPAIYEKYMKLYYKQLNLYTYMSSTGVNDEIRKQLDEVSNEMFNLYRNINIYRTKDNKYEERPVKNPNIKYTPQQELNLAIYSKQEAKALNDFLEAIKKLNNQYFSYKSVYGFEEQLKINLSKIESYEQRKNGIPQVPMDVLEKIEDYVEARKWLRENARYELKIDYSEDNDAISIGAKLEEAFKYLSMTSNNRSNTSNKIIREHNAKETIYDSKGVVDATKLTDKEIDDIKNAQETIYNIKGAPIGSDRILISSAKRNTEIYNSEFYKGLSGNKDIAKVNPEYIKTVTELNKILVKYYDDISGIICFDKIEDTEEGIEELKTIANLYNKIRKLKAADKNTKTSNKEFIKENVEFVTDKDAYTSQMNAILDRSEEYKKYWRAINLERDVDGNYIRVGNKYVANRYIYSYAKPKGKPGEESYDKFIDKKRNEALALINQYYRKVNTSYYYQARSEALRKSREENSNYFDEWYERNHIYNPYTKQVEPLDCWRTSELKTELFDGNEIEGDWIPRAPQRTKTVIDGKTKVKGIEVYNRESDMRNLNYIPETTTAANYVVGAQKGKYDNTIKLNKYEKEMRDYLMNTLIQVSNVNNAKRYFEKGYLPSRGKGEQMNTKHVIKEISKLVGFNISTENGKKEYTTNIGYENDIVPLMPLTKDLSTKVKLTLKRYEDLEEQLLTDKTIVYKIPKPIRNENDINEDYVKELNKWESAKKKVDKHNKEISIKLMDDDWYDVIENYLELANNYNAIQDNKNKLYYLLNMLRRQKAYIREYGATGDLKTDDNGYVKSVDANLINQYENTMKRLLWDQWKEAENKLTKFANGLQGFTSANYMMLNIRGGIANITLGTSGILGEAIAKDYFGTKDYAFAKKEYDLGLISYARGMYDDTSYSKQDAIIKFFKVVDYDETTGVSRLVSLDKWSERIRNFMFSPQTATEHKMQNEALFAMLHSHKLISYPDDPKHIGYRIMNEKEYLNYKQLEILSEIISEDKLKEFNEFKKSISKDANLAKDYAWFRKDLVSEFAATHLNKEEKREFINKLKEKRKQLRKEFEEKENLYSQLELGDNGYMKFKEGSDIYKLDVPGIHKDTTKAIELLGDFAWKVRKVNNKIHGVYNRIGQAYIEKSWYGSLVMQYHKHLPFGLLKRYANRGHYDEFRQSAEKGMLQSCVDFLSLNARSLKSELGINDDEIGAIEAVQNIIKHGLDYVMHIRTTWDLLPDYERDNIRRNLGDFIGVMGGIMTAIALQALGDDDDEDSILYNLALYEADRLSSEAFMYNPIGLMTETKKLMSTPIASQTIINDIVKSSIEIAGFIMQGEDYDPIYKSGRFAGENKLSVFIQRRIPIWNGIRNILDTPENNKYYKVGETASTIIPVKDIAEWIEGE